MYEVRPLKKESLPKEEWFNYSKWEAIDPFGSPAHLEA